MIIKNYLKKISTFKYDKFRAKYLFFPILAYLICDFIFYKENKKKCDCYSGHQAYWNFEGCSICRNNK